MIIVVAVLFVASIASMTLSAGAAPKANPTSGPGKVVVDSDVSSWNVGSGQFNGEFVVAERNGVQIGLRAQERFVGPIQVAPNSNGKVGVYEANTGESSPGRATWNWDMHIDLSNAFGVAKGKTLSDYEITLENNVYSNTSLDLSPFVAIPLFNTASPSQTLFQASQNPVFGNPGFDINAEGVYSLRLVLTPKTFNGAQLAVSIQINVTDSDS